MAQYQYDSTFFDYVDRSAATSAGAVIDELFAAIKPKSVLDVGCGRGVWLAEWRKRGIVDARGIDGDYVDRGALLIPASDFTAHDLAEPLNLDRKFDLVQCLEVAEHVPAEHADTLIGQLVAHSDVILFSAAVPGQGGEFHVNEQPPGYWVERFARQGYCAFDFLRPRIHRRSEIEPWYRYNAILFANDAGCARLSAEALASALPQGQRVPEYGSLGWRFRCWIVRRIPSALAHALAQWKHKLFLLKARTK